MKLGAYLKNKREQSGITLKEMQEKSGIRKDIIRHIEAGDLESLPEPAHAHFLLRQYTRAVGLDFDRLVDRHADEIPEEGTRERKRQQTVNEDYQYFKKVLISFIVMVAALFIGWMILLQVGSETGTFESRPVYDLGEDTATEETTSEDPAENGGTSEETEESTEEAAGEEPASDYSFSGADGSTFYFDVHVVEPLEISLQGDAVSWVTLTDDAGNTYAYEELTEGEYEISPEADIVYLTLGNASGFNVMIDGEPLENPQLGDAVTVYYEFNLVKE